MKRYFLLISLILTICITFSGCYLKNVTSDINNYDNYLDKVYSSSDYMPTIENMGNYSEIKITNKNNFGYIMFDFQTVGVFLTYDDTEYEKQLKYISENYSFYEESPNENCIEFTAKIDGYDIRMEKDVSLDMVYKNCLFIGTNDDENKICYMYFYDSERDKIPNLVSFIEESFYIL